MAKKIAIVEDDSVLRKTMALKLSKMGYEVVEAEDGQVIIDKLDSGEEPDLMLLDIMMPRKDGFDVLKHRNEKNLIPNAQIVMMTNFGQEDKGDESKSLGADGYIVKVNTSLEEMIKVVEQHLS